MADAHQWPIPEKVKSLYPTPEDMSEPYPTLRRMSIPFPYEVDSSQEGEEMPTLRSEGVLQAIDRAGIVYQKESYPVQRSGEILKYLMGLEIRATITCADGQKHLLGWNFNQLNELMLFMTSPSSK
jgi:hypothetical protein